MLDLSQAGVLNFRTRIKAWFYQGLMNALGWHDITALDKRIYARFCFALFLLVASYWIGMIVKAGVFSGVLGMEFEPQMKIINLIALVPMTVFYNFLINKMGDLKAFGSVVLGVYMCMFLLLAFMLTFDWFKETQDSDGIAVGHTVSQVLVGMVMFICIDTFVAVSGTLFWSTVSSVMQQQHSSAVYPVLVVSGQIGAFTGSFLVAEIVKSVGFAWMMLICSFIQLSVLLMMRSALDAHAYSQTAQQHNELLEPLSVKDMKENSPLPDDIPEAQAALYLPASERVRTGPSSSSNPSGDSAGASFSITIPQSKTEHVTGNSPTKPDSYLGRSGSAPRLNLSSSVQNLVAAEYTKTDKPTNTGKKTKLPPTGLHEGLSLIFKRKYVFGLLVISTVPELINSVLSYKMKLLAQDVYDTPNEFSEFMAMYGIATNALGILFGFTGTRLIIRHVGMAKSIVAFPLIALMFILNLLINPILWAAFVGIVSMKVLTTSVNTPAKEMLYVHCSGDIKVKAKSWIEMFGIRSAKASAASINIFMSMYPDQTIWLTPIFVLIFALWIYLSDYLGRTHKDRYDADKHFIIT